MGIFFDSSISEYNIFVQNDNDLRKEFHIINDAKKQKTINIEYLLTNSGKIFMFDSKPYRSLNLSYIKSIQFLTCKHFVPTI